MIYLLKKIWVALKWVILLPIAVWLFGFVIFLAAVYFASPPNPLPELDAAIVLTGGSNRVDQGLELLASKKVRNLMITGVHKGVTPADLVKLWPGDKSKIAESDITLGYDAINTIGNALESTDWVKSHHIDAAYIITANYHIPRAMLEFRHLMPSVKLKAYPVKPTDFDWDKKLFWKTNLIEYHKILISLYRVIIHPSETAVLPPLMTESLKGTPRPTKVSQPNDSHIDIQGAQE